MFLFILVTITANIFTFLWMLVKDNKEVMSMKVVNKIFYLSRKYIAFLITILGVLFFLVSGILWLFIPNYTLLEFSWELINNPLHK